MVLKIASRANISPFIVMDVMRAANERAAKVGDVLHLEVGQPSTAAPSQVIAAAKAALGQDVLGYTEALGVPRLRERIAVHYSDYYGLDVDAARIIVTTGSSGAFLLAFVAAFEAGDDVALASPGYPAYRNILIALGINPVSLPVAADTRFQPTPELVQGLRVRPDGLILASPSNPTGSMLPDGTLQALVETCEDEGIRLISDEIYHGITYDSRAPTALSFGHDVIVVNSFSKYFSMTGWRLGWMVVPENMIRPIECLTQNIFISPPTLSQLAATAVFDCAAELDANVKRYADNRALLLDELPKAGFHSLAPADGAFYLYADVAHLTNDSEAFCQRMLAETGVAATPGIDFDAQKGRHFVRFSFAGSTADMAEAAHRLARWQK